jgi:hypothetical protein
VLVDAAELMLIMTQPLLIYQSVFHRKHGSN